MSLRSAIIKCTGHVGEMERLKAEIWYVVESFDRNFREAGMNALPEKVKENIIGIRLAYTLIDTKSGRKKRESIPFLRSGALEKDD